MKKKLIAFIFAVTAMLCMTNSAFALTDGDWEFQLLDNEVTITDYLGEGGDIVIPNTIYGCPVTKLDGYGMFENATSVSFPSSIKEITDLSYSKKLETVTLSEGTEIIGEGAFAGCYKLKNINLPSTLKKIDSSAFSYCFSLSEIKIPASVTEIGNSAFEQTSIVSIDLSNKNILLGSAIFTDCEHLTSVKLNPERNVIPSSTFRGCTKLEYIDIPASVTKIGDRAFEGCVNLKQIILPVGLKKIGTRAFMYCNSLTEVVIPSGTEIIGGGAINSFEDCNNLRSLYVPDTVKEIGGGSTFVPKNCIVYCNQGSYTEEYCKKNEVSHLTDISVNSGIHVYYNGIRISFHAYGQNPEIIADRTLVPLRSIFEAMNATVEWDQTTSTVTAKRDGVTVQLTIGANEMYKNGSTIAMDVPAQLLNDRTMIPVRVIAEAFGADVQWNGNGRAVLINE